MSERTKHLHWKLEYFHVILYVFSISQYRPSQLIERIARQILNTSYVSCLSQYNKVSSSGIMANSIMRQSRCVYYTKTLCIPHYEQSLHV
jgi:hypothetical protein